MMFPYFTGLGQKLITNSQGGYKEESQTSCLLVLAVYKPNLGCSSPASALSS